MEGTESWQDKRKPNGKRRLDDTTLLGNMRIERVSYETATHPFADLQFLCGENPAGFEETSESPCSTKLRKEILAANSSEIEVLESLPYLDASEPHNARDDRVAIHDDVIPLKNPVTLGNGNIITSLRETWVHY
ncbi:hypothetical protein DFH08DRAFT_827830 [Mycena albidolilacea]|uniref:Uncharacterized protein n=1 Tax=Mycena albidolilacea TaxID=1033008 RepID=A0AAD6YY27_9AGAR|nr:hypothetical protein DFH08DRAFT_827830 [Mycena albidolilacea]